MTSHSALVVVRFSRGERDRLDFLWHCMYKVGYILESREMEKQGGRD